MNFPERSALRQATQRLEGLLGPDESVEKLDVGRDATGRSVECITSNKAVYLVSGTSTVRVPYAEIRSIRGGQTWTAFSTLAGDRYHLDFGVAAHRIHSLLVERYRAEATTRRVALASWCGGAAEFLILFEPTGMRVHSWTIKDCDPCDLMAAIAIEQAVDELHHALGLPLSGVRSPADTVQIVLEWEPPLSDIARRE